MTEHIRSALDKKNFTCAILLDFRKAFDAVNHGILLSKLSLVEIVIFSNDVERRSKNESYSVATKFVC